MIDSYVDKDELRRTTNLAAVCQRLGIKLDYAGRALCPFHENDGQPHSPSFNLWVDPVGIQRWGCFPCGVSGDAFDLVQRIERVSFGDAVRYVAEVAADSTPVDVEPPQKSELDETALRVYVETAQGRARQPQNAGLLCVAAGLRSLESDVEERRELDRTLAVLGWGVDDSANVVMPHYDNYRLCGAKVRSPDGHRWSFPGSKFDRLYGEHLAQPSTRVALLCEGETDFAHAYPTAYHEGVRTYALPRGAGAFREEWVQQLFLLNVETLYLGLDADEAGDRATETWLKAVGRICPATEIRVLQIPREHDLRDCGIAVSYLVATAPIVHAAEE